jgi:Flp pilus assembly protein TadG
MRAPPAARRVGWLRRFGRARRGTIPVEMALCAPVLIVMLLGVVDIGWFAVSRHKMARVAATLADLTSRGETINEAQIADIFAASGSVASPFDFRTEGRAILSSIVRPAGATFIAWQRESPTGIDVDSEIGTTGSTPVLPAGFVVRDGENLVVAEAFFRFQPLIGLVVRGEQRIYVQAFQRPRLGTLDQVAP